MTFLEANKYNAVESSEERVVCSRACLKVIMQPRDGLPCTSVVAVMDDANAWRPAGHGYQTLSCASRGVGSRAHCFVKQGPSEKSKHSVRSVLRLVEPWAKGQVDSVEPRRRKCTCSYTRQAVV